MSDNSYILTTKKTWQETMQELEDQMRLWGVTEWETNYPKGARSEAQPQKEEEIDNVFLLARVMYKAVLGLHFQRQQQKKQGQLAIF